MKRITKKLKFLLVVLLAIPLACSGVTVQLLPLATATPAPTATPAEEPYYEHTEADDYPACYDCHPKNEGDVWDYSKTPYTMITIADAEVFNEAGNIVRIIPAGEPVAILGDLSAVLCRVGAFEPKEFVYCALVDFL